MARNYGRISASIWSDDAFCALPTHAQRMYLFLLSQPNLNHAGILPLTVRRWTRSAHGLTPELVRRDLAMLAKARFIVIDEDTEEVLIRSLVRNDGVWRQPKVMLAMKADTDEIASRSLRVELRIEITRILASDQCKGDARVTATELLDTLPDTLTDTPSDA